MDRRGEEMGMGMGMGLGDQMSGVGDKLQRRCTESSLIMHTLTPMPNSVGIHGIYLTMGEPRRGAGAAVRPELYGCGRFRGEGDVDCEWPPPSIH